MNKPEAAAAVYHELVISTEAYPDFLLHCT
jgi:hypothetical protein